MSRLVVVAALAASSSAYARSLPTSSVGAASTAKPARVALTVDGPWLPTPMPAKKYVSIYDDSAARPRYRTYVVDGTAVPVCTAVTFIYSQK